MQTRSDIENEVKTRAMVGNNSGLFPPDRITKVVQDSTLWAGSLHFWPRLKRPRVATSAKNTQGLNYDYYDYPSDFLDDSIDRVYIDGKLYEQKAYEDFLDYVDGTINPQVQPNPQKRIFANYGGKIFVYPSYSGTPSPKNMIVWGNIQHPPLTTAQSMTIFSQSSDMGNEAICLKSLSILWAKSDPALAKAKEQDAIGYLDVIWDKIVKKMQRAQRLNHQMWQVPDYFGFGSGLSTIGNFNIPVDIINN